MTNTPLPEFAPIGECHATKTRDPFYDCIRGLAILLVVLGHTIQCLDGVNNRLFLGIYLFHMPLFAFLSGLFFIRSYESHTPCDLIKRRFVQLMVPCLSWGAISMAIAVAGKILHHKPIDFAYLVSLLFSGLWYLSTVFGLILIGIAVHAVVRRLRVHGGGGGISLAGRSFLQPST